MEKIMHQKLHILKQSTDSQSLKMVGQLLLSISVFFFLFCHTTLLSFLHSLNFCFSTFPYKLFTHTIDKNCIFLVCNGLLVFLVKYSGLVRSLSLSSHQEESHSEKIIDNSQPELSEPQTKEQVAIPKSISLEENAVVEQGNEEYTFNNQSEAEVEMEKEIVECKEKEQRSKIMALNGEEESALAHVAEDGEENKRSMGGFLVEQGMEEDDDDEEVEDDIVFIDEEEEEEEVGNGRLSTEELNKKFDEFIRRMKEELRLEAQRQLIMAV